jgi:chromosome partitioning protein
MGKIIAICNQKGGVGKTTTVVNLSACLAALEKKVLIIDMDPQGNASQGVGLHEVQDEDIYEALQWAEDLKTLNTNSINSIIHNTDIPFLKILPSSTSLAGFELEVANKLKREFRLKEVIEHIKDDYDYIFIDSPPSLGLLTINVLTAADSIIIPIQCEYYALQGLTEMLNTIRLVQKSLNSQLEIEGALLTMFDHRLNLSKQVAEEVQNCFSERVFKTIIPRNVRLSEAPSFGKPIILHDILCSGSQKYMELAKEFIQMQEALNG